MKEIPVWYFTRPYPVDTRANAGAAASPVLNEPLSDFDDYNLADKESSEKKDNYIVKGLFWDPECVIV
ncbi:hypothetical protein DAKH74_011800 [Maudiozyma humilis]|uniref:Uncharacterized protein n=1 Tax=Maudiozyma humilis TaxID=51915 RepID=A0AAV5RSL4_MAUHU|nr:hypothetical protein DAKH74_011800 [Kazachstania humilis]